MSKPNKPSNIGYKNPPKNSQFQKGKSGNPNGRPKGGRNMGILFKEGLNKTITIIENGKSKKMTVREAIVHRTLIDAVKGNTSARELVIEHAKEVFKDHEFLNAEQQIEMMLEQYSDDQLKHMLRALSEYGETLTEKDKEDEDATLHQK